jgi:large subunit ribosomal protein L19
MDILGQIEAEQFKKEIPPLRPGETVRVHVKVVEGEKERTQIFEGIVIGLSGKSNRATFTVRKISYGVGVERIFPLHSPRIEKVDVVSRGKVRRAKLYYLRDRSGKAARVYGEEGPAGN